MENMVKKISSEDFAKKIRLHVLEMIFNGRSSHIASAFSMSDILGVLFNEILNIDPDNVSNPKRDRFILSKGHAGAAVYAALSLKGFFPEADLLKHYQNGSMFSGHISHHVKGVEFSTGSLGHGLGVICGISIRCKSEGHGNKNYVLLSDGELNEGSNWEALLFASHHKLNNLTIIVDRNHYQSIHNTEETLALEPLKRKFEAFNLDTYEINGHDLGEIRDTLNLSQEGPKIIICNTVKGKGVSFIENNIQWHYTPPSEDEYKIAKKELLK